MGAYKGLRWTRTIDVLKFAGKLNVGDCGIPIFTLLNLARQWHIRPRGGNFLKNDH